MIFDKARIYKCFSLLSRLLFLDSNCIPYKPHSHYEITMSECVEAKEEPPVLRTIVIVANVIGVIYNVPQVVYTIRSKSANDLSGIFLSLRIISACLWILYTTILWSPDVFISWVITGTSSVILMVYKIRYANESWKKEFSMICPCLRMTPPRQQLQEESTESV